MITRIEIDFALPVELTAEEVRWINSFVQRIAKRHEPEGWVHWCAEYGSKPQLSQFDAVFLGKVPDPSAPMSGEPTFDDSVLYLATAAREAYPEEIARRQEREAWRAYRMLPWWRKIWTKAPPRRAA